MRAPPSVAPASRLLATRDGRLVVAPRRRSPTASAVEASIMLEVCQGGTVGLEKDVCRCERIPDAG